jgi:CheY-like chemotaxis protein
LAITRSLLQLMGGDISAQGQLGLGACFVATIPVKRVLDLPQPLACATGSEILASPGWVREQVLSVLLVEDHEINRKLAEIMLQRMGYRYATACDGQEALDLLAVERFDVVLMDVMMPEMDGITAMRLLREREAQTGQHTKVLMVTAHAMTGDKERFLAEGADGYVSKPMSQAALQKEITRVFSLSPPSQV